MYAVIFSLSSSVSSYSGGIAFTSFRFNAGGNFYVGTVSVINTTNTQGATGGKNVIAVSGIASQTNAPVQDVTAAYFNDNYTTFTEIVKSGAMSSSGISLTAQDFYVLK